MTPRQFGPQIRILNLREIFNMFFSSNFPLFPISENPELNINAVFTPLLPTFSSSDKTKYDGTVITARSILSFIFKIWNHNN